MILRVAGFLLKSGAGSSRYIAKEAIESGYQGIEEGSVHRPPVHCDPDSRI